MVTVYQTYVDDWEVAIRYGATTAARYNSISGPADSEARGQARWFGGLVWLDDFAGALAVDRCAALLGFSGPQVHEERRWLSLARWAAEHPEAGRHGYVGAWPPHDQGQEDAYPRRRRRLIEGGD